MWALEGGSRGHALSHQTLWPPLQPPGTAPLPWIRGSPPRVALHAGAIWRHFWSQLGDDGAAGAWWVEARSAAKCPKVRVPRWGAPTPTPSPRAEESPRSTCRGAKEAERQRQVVLSVPTAPLWASSPVVVRAEWHQVRTKAGKRDRGRRRLTPAAHGAPWSFQDCGRCQKGGVPAKALRAFDGSAPGS